MRKINRTNQEIIEAVEGRHDMATAANVAKLIRLNECGQVPNKVVDAVDANFEEKNNCVGEEDWQAVIDAPEAASKGKVSKAKFTEINDRRVDLSFTDVMTGELIAMEIWAPMPASGKSTYIRYNGDKQLCDKLSCRGSTLTFTDGQKLVDIVRREYKAMRAADKREAAKNL